MFVFATDIVTQFDWAYNEEASSRFVTVFESPCGARAKVSQCILGNQNGEDPLLMLVVSTGDATFSWTLGKNSPAIKLLWSTYAGSLQAA